MHFLKACKQLVLSIKEQQMRYLLRAWVALRPSWVKNLVGLTIIARPHVYPGPGALRVKFLGNFTVLLVVPARPTLIWKEEAAFDGSWLNVFITPALQQLAICMLYGVPGSRSTIVGSFLQQWGVLPLNFEQSPCSVVCAPTIDQMTSFFAHVHPSCHPGAWMCRNC
uniref:Uncharacterized protein n=1 Tax=Oryza brachyantha TaxID=4533 RepID=J3M6Q6_ORYBR